MIELTVKTLDSKNHTFSVPDDVTVRQLKERIAESVNISAESQRLIYCGRVLQDEKNLSEYDVNGKVIHLVQRAPPVNNGNAPDRGPSTTRSAPGFTGPGTRRTTQQWRTLFGPGGNSGNAMYLGAMAFPAEIMDASGISMQQPRQCLSQSRLAVVRNMLRRASVILNRLENPPQESSNETSPDNGSGPSETNTEEETVSAGVPIATVEISPGSFIIDNQQIDVGGPSVEVQTETATEQNNSTAENEPQTASTSDQPAQQNDNEGDNNSGTSRYPRTRALAELMDQATDINIRVQPFMSQYQQLMRDDPAFTDQAAVATSQRLFTGVSEIMHNLAHAYHALSDIMCDFSQQPPRFLRCRPVLIHHSAVVQTGIPIQVSASLASGNNSQPASSNGNARTNESSSRPASTSATSVEETATTSAGEATATTQATPSATEEPTQPDTGAVPNTAASAAAAATATATATTSAAGSPEQAASSSQQPRSPSTSPPRVARIGSVGGGGPGFEFFVDVAPGSITIDSVETTVVTNAPPNTSEANTWQNPPEFVQNLITALAGQFMGATLQQYRYPEQQNAGTNTQQATPAGSTQQPQSEGSSQQSQSASAAGSQQNPAANTQNSQARGNTATHPTTATQTRSTARPHVHLSPSIHGLRTTNFDPFLPCNSHHIRGRGGRHRTAQAQANNGSNSTGDAPRVVPIPAPSSISISLRADPIINVEQHSSRNTRPQRAPLPDVPAEIQEIFQNLRGPSLTPEQVFPHQMASLVQALYGGGQTSSTLAQLLENVPGYSYTPGESMFTDIFMTLAQSLSFMDMVQLGLGSSESLIRARPHLRRLISHFLHNEQRTPSAITQVIDQFNSELRPYYHILEHARLRDDVDLPASINQYNHSMLPSIVDAVMEQDQTSFHRSLMRKCTLYVRQLCALLQYCCLDGVSGLERILCAFVNQMTTGVPSVLQEWTLSHSVLNFRTFVSSLNVTPDDIKRFLVYRGRNPATAASPQPANVPPPVPPAAEPMDTQDIEEVEVESTPGAIREPPVADVPPTQHINEVMGWQNTLPSEWVPIITRDSQRQRRQNPQGPFSDAYLSGMPSKRRKLITSAKPQGNLSQVISESMASALGSAGMSSGPEVDVIAQRAGQDHTLRTAYREQVRTTLRQNLNSNSDYSPEKYPNTSKYLKKQ